MLIQQIKNFLWRQKSAPFQDKDGYLPYFEDDTWPLKWHKTISESPSASACVSTIADFLEGFGFSNTDLENRIVNSQNETFFQIHQKTVHSFAEFEGFYWHFMFDGAGRITEWRVLPFESCRLAKTDSNGVISKIYFNPFFGTNEYVTQSVRKKDTIKYHTFNPSAVPLQLQEEGEDFKGQVLFVGTTTALSRFYPYPEATSAEEWMKIEAGVATYHQEHIDNGLLQPYILVMKGNPNDPSTNPEYSDDKKSITVSQEFQRVIGENFMGAKRVGNLMVQWVNVGQQEETPEVVPLPTNANGDLFVTLDNQATKKITVAFKVPAILANINDGVSLGGDGNAVRVAVKLMQQRSIKKQRILTDAYALVGRNMARPFLEPIVIVPYNPYPEMEIIDDKIWNEMTNEERRKWIQDNTEIELTEDEVVQPVSAKIINAVPTGFPEGIRKSVKKALDIDDKLGKGCGKKGPREMSEKIVNNTSMGLKELKRIYRYVKDRQHLADSTLDNCDSIQYHQWGGKEMENFLEERLKLVDEWLN